jgi:hypothetical protein
LACRVEKGAGRGGRGKNSLKVENLLINFKHICLACRIEEEAGRGKNSLKVENLLINVKHICLACRIEEEA